MSVPSTPTGVPVPRRVVVILLLVIPLSQIPLDIYTPALPQMVLDLDASPAVVQNTVTAYMLGMSLAFIPVGIIADAVGRKRTLLTCLAILVVTSVGCALVQDITVLLGLRFVQGIGGCACLVLAYAVAADCYRGARLTSVSGLLGAAWGLAPVLAPAVGGVLVQFISWRLVFGLIALLAALAVPLVVAGLPETLPPESRTPVDVTAAARVLGVALRHRIFVGFVLVFGLMASAQMVFGVVAPFLYQEILGFSPAAYGAVALVVGGANLLGELACGALAVRVGTRRLAFGAWWVFVAGALVLTVTAGLSVVTAPAITIGACLALAGCGVLCPQMYGLALGLFSRNLGLIGGVVTAACYLVVSAAMAVAGVLPETSQAPLGWLYLALGAGAGILLLLTTSARRSDNSPVASPAPRPERR
ncbi:MAG: Bcr/CflA family efflux MFS transporter [Rhodococcus sp. (in: high G+C Gram-positive bacteria)]|nr:MAG: Bcr/CflA family efflux MFS transporter [Rhodococcus sp. (in: high G+C Gram-positive bacteria)]